MKALRIYEYIGENGLSISIDKLEEFKNKKVEIIILDIENETNKIFELENGE